MPIEKRKNGAKDIDSYTENHKINKEQSVGKNRDLSNYESNISNRSSQLTGWVIVIGIILACFIIFTLYKLNTFKEDYIGVLEEKVKTLEGKVSVLEKNGDWEVYTVNYEGGSSITNNLKWIGEKSLGFPTHLKGKKCYILGSKMSGDDGGTVRGFLGKNGNGSSYSFATNYEARINNFEEKIEITKRNGSSSMLTKNERDNLYFSLTLLCR